MLFKKSNLFRWITCLSVIVVTCSCSKPTTGKLEDLYQNSPATPIPNELKGGIWFWGNTGPIAYYDRDGHQLGNATEAAREYTFTEVRGQGRLVFTQYLGMRNASNCVTEIYTVKRGTVVFESNDKMRFYPVEGTFRTVKKGCSDAGTTLRSAMPSDLVPVTYLWEIKLVADNRLLYTYEETDTAKQNPLFVYSFSL